MDADGSEFGAGLGESGEGAPLAGANLDADIFVDIPAMGASYVGPVPSGGDSILQRNIKAVRQSCARTAELIEHTAPRHDVVFIETDDGVLSATLGVGDDARALASKRRPLAEANKIAESFDLNENGAAAILGFGLGHHAQALASKVRKSGVVLCFEPDVALLRAVFERIDHSQWMRETNFAIFTDPEDSGLISARLRGMEPIVSLGTTIVHHAPSRPRLGRAAQVFGDNLARVLLAIRTNLVTTLVQVEITQRNLLQNLDRYVCTPGVADLKGRCAGRPAIVVSAGPSLARNIHVLSDPAVQERFVIVAAQTVLKQLLEAGIKPNFITALDYHEISKRFYEGLTAEDVEGVTLIAEAKANPAILDAFPGRIRIPKDKYLSAVMGADKDSDRRDKVTPSFHVQSSDGKTYEASTGYEVGVDSTHGKNGSNTADGFGADLLGGKGELKPGATVAHLAYYVARHLGCDPVILTGQDLGFTDGQYYAAGAAIHRVWSGELNAFNTLEMMEWQRIVRARRTLHRTKDVLGRPIYTDEQMLAYLTQFERDFLADSDRSLRVIDATEGGVAKQHTQAMALERAVEEFMPDSPLSLPETSTPKGREALKPAMERVRSIRADIARVGSLSREGKTLLRRMLDCVDDTGKLNELIRRIERITARVTKLDPAYALVQQLNQNGALKRLRADRQIQLASELSPTEKQRRQIERDIMNVDWLADAADQLGMMFDEANEALHGAPKIVRDKPIDESALNRTGQAQQSSHNIWAVIPIDVGVSGLGVKRSLAAANVNGVNVLRRTLQQLARSATIENVAILTDTPSEVAAIIGKAPGGLRIETLEVAPGAIRERSGAIGAARRWAPTCWRGGLASLTCFDEAFDPGLVDAAMEKLGIDAAVVLGPDWAMVDPDLIDEVVRRHLERPGAHKLTFAHAPPGLAPCLLERSVVREMASESEAAGVLATIGGLVGYVPIRPQADPIVKPLCVRTEAMVRDSQRRVIADTDAAIRMLEGLGTTVETVVGSWPAESDPIDSGLPQQLTIEINGEPRTGGLRGDWCDSDVGAEADLPWIERLVQQWCGLRPDAALTLAGRGDPLHHPGWSQVVSVAKEAGAAVHIRTDLACEGSTLEKLLASGVDVVSVDLLADDAPVYESITGEDRFEQVKSNIERLIEERTVVRGIPKLWVVPRITRCDATYEQVETFFDRWIMRAGCAVIDPLPRAMPGERIAPLPLPAEANRRRLSTELVIRSDGSVCVHPDVSGPCVCDIRAVGLASAWQEVLLARHSGATHKSELLASV